MDPVSLPDRVREGCAWVAARAGAVRIEEAAVEPYALTLDTVTEDGEGDAAGFAPEPGADREDRAAFAVCLDAINFGSGWWPTIRKRPGHSGFFTVAAGLGDRFREHGSWSAGELTRLGAADLAAVLGQDPEHPLMAQFAAALRDVGEHLGAEHGGSFTAAVDSAAGSVPALAALFAQWEAFADASTYMGRPVPFFKRAQLAAADLARAGVAESRDLDRLTAFADNLVPHVLRVDGVLRLDPGLTAGIEAGDLLVHGSPEEVELRACAVHSAALAQSTAALAWPMSQGPHAIAAGHTTRPTFTPTWCGQCRMRRLIGRASIRTGDDTHPFASTTIEQCWVCPHALLSPRSSSRSPVAERPNR